MEMGGSLGLREVERTSELESMPVDEPGDTQSLATSAKGLDASAAEAAQLDTARRSAAEERSVADELAVASAHGRLVSQAVERQAYMRLIPRC